MKSRKPPTLLDERASKPRLERSDKARNRARIVDAAAATFAAVGVDAQMDTIAARAGVGVGTLYGHFATKSALMEAIVARKYETLVEMMEQGISRIDSEPFEILADVLRKSAEVTAADAGTRIAVMGADEGILNGLKVLAVKLSDATQVLIDRARATNSIRDDLTPADVAMLMHGVAATMGSESRDWHRHLELALDGMRHRASR